MTTQTGKAASQTLQVGGALVRKALSTLNPSAGKSVSGGPPASGWLAVTVLCDPADLDTAPLPEPLARFGDEIEVVVRPAPGGKGAELAARLRDRRPPGSATSRLSGTDPQAGLRSALRRAKQLVEVGEVLAVDPAPHGERTETPTGKLLEAWTRAAPQGGVR